eukprot:scaffold329507_cov116-Tisochrysis_lutea.AAC.1
MNSRRRQSRATHPPRCLTTVTEASSIRPRARRARARLRRATAHSARTRGDAWRGSGEEGQMHRQPALRDPRSP